MTEGRISSTIVFMIVLSKICFCVFVLTKCGLINALHHGENVSLSSKMDATKDKRQKIPYTKGWFHITLLTFDIFHMKSIGVSIIWFIKVKKTAMIIYDTMKVKTPWVYHRTSFTTHLRFDLIFLGIKKNRLKNL